MSKRRTPRPEVSSPPASESRPSCELVLCEDPDTHEILIKPKGECPAGYVERIRDKAAADGVTFLIPKVKTRAVDE